MPNNLQQKMHQSPPRAVQRHPKQKVLESQYQEEPLREEEAVSEVSQEYQDNLQHCHQEQLQDHPEERMPDFVFQ